MSNKARNAEAVHIHRPLITGQLRGINADIEAAITGIVAVVFGVSLLPPCNPKALWRSPRRA